jgi:hypothetical protein
MTQTCPTCGSIYTPGVRTLRGMADTCHWVEHLPDGDYQCDMSPGHWRESHDSRAMYSHRPTIRLIAMRLA